jgi:16S rRNA (cytosine967-C5)-methyltransferase
MTAGGDTPQSLDQALAGDSFAPPVLDDQERAAWASRNLADAPDAVRADVPDWCVPHLQAAFGGDWIAEAAALAQRPPLDLRANTLKASRAKVLKDLQHLGAMPGPIAPDAVRIAPIEGSGRHPNVQAEPAFAKGWFEVQDEGSQIVALLTAPDAPVQVLDYCAGAGGKTLALAAGFANKGQIFAYDSEKARLAPIFNRLKRASVHNVQVFARAEALAPLESRMDLVLVDAPCTGSGTWRRRPDAKWRLSERQLETRVGEQAAILEQAARHVRPGGRLAYITCSVFPDENERQIEAFVATHPGFAVRDLRGEWARKLPETVGRARFGPFGAALSPRLTGTDGFFIGVLEREG